MKNYKKVVFLGDLKSIMEKNITKIFSFFKYEIRLKSNAMALIFGHLKENGFLEFFNLRSTSASYSEGRSPKILSSTFFIHSMWKIVFKFFFNKTNKIFITITVFIHSMFKIKLLKVIFRS